MGRMKSCNVEALRRKHTKYLIEICTAKVISAVFLVGLVLSMAYGANVVVWVTMVFFTGLSMLWSCAASGVVMRVEKMLEMIEERNNDEQY